MKNKIILVFTVFFFCIAMVGFLHLSKKKDMKQETTDSFMNSHLANVEYVDEMAFEYIQEIYTEIDFESVFVEGDTSNYDCYKEIFRQLLNGERVFYRYDTEEQAYLPEYRTILQYDGEKYLYNPENYLYLFFDIDIDGEQELCLLNRIQGIPTITDICIFNYDKETDKIFLWNEYNASYFYIYGSKKIGWDWQGREQSAFYQLNEGGEVEMAVLFMEDNINGMPIYMVTLPQYTDEDKQVKVPKQIKSQLFYDEEFYYFRITEEQYYEITSTFRKEREIAQTYLENNMLTYEELFLAK